jgi:NLI interacting factor-like phosphatase
LPYLPPPPTKTRADGEDTKNHDFSIALNLERDYGLSYIYVGKRPHLKTFLEEMGKIYEIVIFTASLQRVQTPGEVGGLTGSMRIRWLILLMSNGSLIIVCSVTRVHEPGTVSSASSSPTSRSHPPDNDRLFLCWLTRQNLSLLGRDLRKCIIIDNNPQCYQMHPEHAVPISSWFEDHLDVELLTMIPLLQDLARDDVEDVRDVLCQDFHGRMFVGQ